MGQIWDTKYNFKAAEKKEKEAREEPAYSGISERRKDINLNLLCITLQ